MFGKKNKYDYDLAVIGSGAAGGTAALMAAGVGLKTALVEAGNWGGANLNSRDIPYAAASTFSHSFFGAKAASRFGLSSANLKFNYPTSLSWQQIAKKRAGADSKKDFKDAGIDCIDGFAQFISPNEIAVSERGQISAKYFLIATGTEPAENHITTNVHCYQPEEALTLPRVPKVVMVVGGGSTGCEMAEYFAELGSKVLLAEISERLLPKEDPEAGEVIEGRLSKVLGVKVLTQSRVQSVMKDGSVVKVSFLRGGQQKSVRVEAVVFATGSKPFTDLGLENAGVKYELGGINVLATMQTTVKHIYAAGDVACTPVFKGCDPNDISSSEKASYEAAIATSNIINHSKVETDYRGFVRMTATDPQVAAVGLTEDECMNRDLKYRQELVPISMIQASNVNDFYDGFAKIVVDRDKNILGATVVMPHADIAIQELANAMRAGMKVDELASMPHVALGWTDAIRIAARKLGK